MSQVKGQITFIAYEKILLEFKETLHKILNWIFPGCCKHVKFRIT